MNDIPVRVEVAPGNDDRVRERSLQHHVHRRKEKVAHDLAPFTSVDQLAHVIGAPELHLGRDQHTPDVENVRVIHKRVVRVGVLLPQLTLRQSRALHRHVLRIRIPAVGARCGGNIRIAARIHHHLCKNYAPALRSEDHHSGDALAFHHHTLAQRAKPHIHTRLP